MLQLTDISSPLPGAPSRPRVLTAGVFDGMHRAHQALIRHAVQQARPGGTAIVLTFPNHPLSVLAPAYQPKKLLPPERKAEILAALGVDILITPEFTHSLAETPPARFVEETLLGRWNIDHLLVGFDFRFGAEAGGDIALLREMAAARGFALETFPAVRHSEWAISSTRLRELIEEGQVRLAAEMLGRPYELEGPVIHGYGRGRTLGFPTANVQFDPAYAIPASGVYAILAETGGKRYAAMMNLGYSPTFEGSAYRPEAFLFEYPGDDLYGKTMRIHFIERIREERKFPNAATLIERIRVDETLARAILAEHREKNTESTA